jgi:hypothetical protein
MPDNKKTCPSMPIGQWFEITNIDIPNVFLRRMKTTQIELLSLENSTKHADSVQ